MRSTFALLWLVAAPIGMRADRVADLARIHCEAIGGMERIAALTGLRATGQVEVGGHQVRFTMIAQRPNRVRIETHDKGRTLVQATDGSAAAWEFGGGTATPNYRAMDERIAKTFVADAEFDDPLISGSSRGYAIDLAGESEMDGRRFIRLLVTHRTYEPFSLLIDPITYLIVTRVEQRATATGRKVPVVTRYGDFRPVDGVLLPHELITSVDGHVTQQTRIDRIEANPVVAPDMFTRPKVTPSEHGVEGR